MSYRFTMTDEHAERKGDAPDATRIAAAHAIYTPFMLSFYDRLVHRLSNRFAWRCPTERIIRLYRDNLSSRHLEAGVGTGFFIDRANPAGFEELTLLDINRHCLARSAQRLARYHPLLCETNLLAPIASELEPADSIGLTYVLHCLPGSVAEKLKAIDHLQPVMSKGTVLFGARSSAAVSSRTRSRDLCFGSTMPRACSTISMTTCLRSPTVSRRASATWKSRRSDAWRFSALAEVRPVPVASLWPLTRR
jgi:hypothetical protein